MFLIESDFSKVVYVTDFESEREKLARTLCHGVYCVGVCMWCVFVCVRVCVCTQYNGTESS